MLVDPMCHLPSVLTDVELLQQTKQKCGFKTDVELAHAILTNKAAISNINAGRKPLAQLPKLRCYALLGHDWATVALRYLDPHS